MLFLAPVPKKLTYTDGTFTVKPGTALKLLTGEGYEPTDLSSAAKRIKMPLDLALTDTVKVPASLTIKADMNADIPCEGYTLSVKPTGITINASTPQGAFYGACTLTQIYDQCGDTIPCMEIEDAPDMGVRGVMLDVSRDKVPTMETLKEIIDKLASMKINQFQMYMEHTFKYLNHPTVWKNASPVSAEEILELQDYCEERFVELVPNQNSFGHMERWLKFDEYRPLADSPNGGESFWGHFDDPFSLCPIDPKAKEFINSLFDELLPCFKSDLFNVGCDETKELGYEGSRSKNLCDQVGTGRVYIDYIKNLHKEVTARGKRMMFWGDIIIKYPELIPEIPEDAIVLEWGYDAKHPFAEHCPKFAETGLDFYVCPGTSNWCSIAGRTTNMIENIKNAAKVGLANGTLGMLNTSWGDRGHQDPLPVTWPGFMVGAMASWNAEKVENVPETLSACVFGDNTGKTGKVICDMGDAHLVFNNTIGNSSVPWHLVFNPSEHSVKYVTAETLNDAEAYMKDIDVRIAELDCDEKLMKEITYVSALLKLAVKCGRAFLAGKTKDDLKADYDEIKKRHREVWLLRNRPGGLEDSVNWFTTYK